MTLLGGAHTLWNLAVEIFSNQFVNLADSGAWFSQKPKEFHQRCLLKISGTCDLLMLMQEYIEYMNEPTIGNFIM